MKLYFKKGIQLTEEEEKLFQTSLDKFATYCRYRNYDSTELLEDIQELKEHGVKQEEERRRETEVSLITKYELPRVVNYYRKENYPYYSKADNQSVFMLNKIPSFAFSISYLEDGSIRFGIHVLDYSKVVEQDSLLAEDLLYDREQLPSMSIGHTYPVTSFSYCIRDYELSPLEISSGVIQLDQMYKEEDLDCYREKEDLKSMFYFLKMFQTGEEVYQQEGMEEIINKKLSQDIKRKFEEEHIPMIYEVNIVNKEDLIQRNHNAIVEELGKIPKTEAHQIFDILDQEIDSYYTDDLHQESSVCFDSGSFLGIYLLDTLNKIKNGRYDVEIGYQNNDAYLQKLNEKRDYLPTCFKENGKTYQKEKSI